MAEGVWHSTTVVWGNLLRKNQAIPLNFHPCYTSTRHVQTTTTFDHHTRRPCLRRPRHNRLRCPRHHRLRRPRLDHHGRRCHSQCHSRRPGRQRPQRAPMPPPRPPLPKQRCRERRRSRAQRRRRRRRHRSTWTTPGRRTGATASCRRGGARDGAGFATSCGRGGARASSNPRSSR